MKLDNIDLSKLEVEQIPKFDKCPCELCDDGCFDRAGYQHHPECRKKTLRKSKLSINARCPLTHYQSTFLAAINPQGKGEDHRRQPCPPAPDNEIPISFKNAPMQEMSSQREHYQAPPPGAFKKNSDLPAKQADNLVVKKTVPMDTKTQYQVEYVEKPVMPVAMRPLKDPTRESNIPLADPLGTISSQTTARSHFQSWKSAPAHPYAELPAIAGHVLFPGSQRQFSTSTGSTFIPFENAAKARPLARPELNGSLHLSGSMDLRTNYREDFIPHEQKTSRSTTSEKRSKSMEGQVYFRRPMNEVSQTTFDYRAYPDHRPPAPAEMETFASQVQLKHPSQPETKRSQYRVDYEGIDTSRHPRAPLAAPKDRTYVPPVTKMDTLTVTKRDFQPLDISSLPRIRLVPLKANLSVQDEKSPMESVSMSRFHFQPYDGVKVKRYGDPMPSVYVPPLEKFEGRTTNADTYQGRQGPRARPVISEVKVVQTVGSHDMRTNYRVDFHPHGLSLCAAKAYALAQQKKKNTETPIATQ